MRGTGHDAPTDYLEFQVDKKNYRVNLSFLMSNWKCIYGDGCAGHFGIQDKNIYPDVGCCSDGAFIEPEEFDALSERVKQLTDNEWQPELRAIAESKGWYVNQKERKTRVYQKSCIFNNRAGGSNGKTGCAFHVLAERTGVHFTETKPSVCWQVPLRVFEDGDGVTIVDVWDADEWGGMDEDGTHNHWMCWWCTDTPDAYVGKHMVFQEMAMELRKLMGDNAYAEMVRLIIERIDNRIAPMMAISQNNGKPLLPILTINRKPVRNFGGYSS